MRIKICKKKCFAVLIALVLSFVSFGLYSDNLKRVDRLTVPITITATGAYGIESKGAEVWLISANCDGTFIDLSQHESDDWQLNDNYGLVNKTAATTPLVFEITSGSNLELVFLKHAWSGGIEIEQANKLLVQNLYSEVNDQYNFSVKMPANISFSVILYFAICIVFLFAIYYTLIRFWRKKNKIAASAIGLMLGTIFVCSPNLSSWDTVTQVVTVLLLGYISMRVSLMIWEKTCGQWFKTWPQRIVLAAILIYGTAACTYNQVVVAHDDVRLGVTGFSFVFICLFALAGAALTFFQGMDRLRNWVSTVKQPKLLPKAETKLWLLQFGIVIAGFSFWAIACAPANMSKDSFLSWLQATGELSLENWEPVFYTLLVRASMLFVQSPFVTVICQIVIHAAIWATGGILLYRSGLPKTLVIALVIFVAVMPNNGIFAATIWKDVAFAIAMLALTICLARITKGEKLTVLQQIMLVVAMFCSGLIRHNGIFPVIATAMVLFLFYFKKRMRVLPFLALALIFLMQSFGYDTVFKAEKTPKFLSMAAPLNDLGAVMYYGGKFDDESLNLLTRYVPAEIWINKYSPTSANGYLFTYGSTDKIVADVLQDISAATIMKIYIKTFLKNPVTVINARLINADVNWSVFKMRNPNVSFYRYMWGSAESFDVWERGSAEFFDMQERGDAEIFDAWENSLTSTAKFIIEKTSTSQLADSIFWHVGGYIIGFMLLAYYAWVKKFGKINLVVVPVLVNFLFMFLGTSSQDYRYGHLAFLIFPFVLLFYACFSKDENVSSVNTT